MKLAINYSDSLVRVLKENPALELDFIKVPTRPFPGAFVQFDDGASWRRLLPHPAQPGVLALGHPDGEQRFNSEVVAEIVRRTQPAYLSTHIEARLEFFPEYRQFQHNNNSVLRQAMQERFINAIAQVKQKVGLPLVLENCPYYQWADRFKLASEPDFITAICKLGDCGLLLDIAHARCSAWAFGVSITDYIAALPLERLREIHMAGVQEKEYGVRDTHTALQEVDYQLLEMVLERVRPEILTLEYGGMPEQIQNPQGKYEPISRNDPQELTTMIGRLRKIIARLN